MPDDSSGEATRSRYRLPPEPIPTILDATPTPALVLSPDRQWLGWLGRRGLPPVAELAEPELPLAGVRINPHTNGRSRQSYLVSLSFGRLDGELPRPADLPADARLTHPRWSPDSRHLAFVHTGEQGLELWIAEAASGACRRLATPPLNATLGLPFRWLPDGSGLIAACVPLDRGDPPERPAVAEGPLVQESAGRVSATRTYQDLLDGPHSEALFEFYFASRLWSVPLAGPARGFPDVAIVSGFDPSPDGSCVLVETIQRPYSYSVPLHRFPVRVELLDRNGGSLRRIADLPLADAVPPVFDAVPAGPRGFQWRADAPSELVWIEALDGGDPRVTAALRDRVVSMVAPEGTPRTLIELEHRWAGVQWGRGDFAIIYSRWWARRTERRIAFAPDRPGEDGRLLVERSYQDLYGDPGWPLTTRTAAGRPILAFDEDGESIFLSGEGASAEGNFPFLDRMRLESGETTRLWQCARDAYEPVAALLDDSGNRFITRHETHDEPPNYRIRDLASGSILPLTRFPDPAPQLAGMRRRLISYRRDDGVMLNATLVTPPGHDPERDGPLPAILWAYPREFRDAGDASQLDDSPNRFSRPGGASHLFLLTQGYAVIDGPSMPIVGEGEAEPNDTYVRQLVSSAEAAVRAAAETGAVDPERVAVGGHSYGAFMAANLLAHTRLFRAGIARSGAYNRTLTPFGFQQEQRSYWEAPDTYHAMSPFSHAHRIVTPLLLIHGAEDSNPGTFPLQTERFFHALRGHGAVSRYVLLPHEGHGYRGRESVLHTIAEMVDWMTHWVWDATPREEPVAESEPVDDIGG